MPDLHNNIHVIRAISPVSVTDNTAQVSQIIDRQGYDSLEFMILAGALADADATFAVLVEHGDAPDLSDAAAVPDSALLGTEAVAAFTFADDDSTRKIGYIGSRQFVRLTITPSSNDTACLLAAAAVLGHPNVGPTPNPPTAPALQGGGER